MKDILSLKKVMDLDLPKQDFLVHDLIQKQSITIISGAPSSFKTWALYELVRDIASGEDFLGRFRVSQARVLILDAEMGTSMFQQAMSTLSVDENLSISYCEAGGDELSSKEKIQELVSFCQSNNIEVVAIDCLTRFHEGDENSSQAMSGVFRLLKMLKTAGLSVIIIHHDKKSGYDFGGRGGNALRGSSDISGAADYIIRLVRRDGSDSVTFKQVKSRGFIEHEPFMARFERTEELHSEWKFIDKVTGKNNQLESDKSAILEFIGEHPGIDKGSLFMSIKRSEASNKISHSRFQKALDALEAEDKVGYEIGNHNRYSYYLKNVGYELEKRAHETES